jgi:hypothetical protein
MSRAFAIRYEVAEMPNYCETQWLMLPSMNGPYSPSLKLSAELRESNSQVVRENLAFLPLTPDRTS